MVFQRSFMVFHGFWLVSMFFQGSFMVSHVLAHLLSRGNPDPKSKHLKGQLDPPDG